MLITELLILAFGLFLLWGGAELLVKYASLLAQSLGISPLIVGLTVVSLGTSFPELLVSSMAAFQAKPGISIGNIIGSNIANIGLILGVGALIFPLEIKASWVKREVPFMIIVTAIFIAMAYGDGMISQIEGVVLICLLILFISYLAKYTLKEMGEFQELLELQEQAGEDVNAPKSADRWRYFGFALVGTVVLLAGSQLTVDSATTLATKLGVSDSLIGLTLVAFGTSLPELATTIVSAMRKEVDLAVGNVIGSNIFNLTLVGGVTSLIRPLPIATGGAAISTEFALLASLSLIIWPMMRWRWNIQRMEGAALLFFYLCFIFFTTFGV